MSRRGELAELAKLFLVLGALGFGGPPAHLALFEQAVVVQRKWISRDELMEMLAAANLVPGPNSTEVAFAMGYRRAGLLCTIVAGASFIFPAALLTGMVAMLYVRYGSLPEVGPFLTGTKAAVIGVMVGATMRLAPGATKTPTLAVLGSLSLIASAIGAPEVAVLLGAGLIAALGKRLMRPSAALVALWGSNAWAAGGTVALACVSLGSLFLFFLQVGATIYGGGFVLASYLNTTLVGKLGWLTPNQLLDAITVGQITPGPVFSTATFVGYVIAGGPGAAVATVAIFLPCFLLVPVLHRLLDWARKHPATTHVLEGLAVASLGLMLAVAIKLAPASIVGWLTGLLALAAWVATLMKVNPAIVVLGSGALFWLTSLL
jgi:chromate transporter